MGSRALDIADLEFQVGDHVCAFYNGGGSALDDIVVDYVLQGAAGWEQMRLPQLHQHCVLGAGPDSPRAHVARGYPAVHYGKPG